MDTNVNNVSNNSNNDNNKCKKCGKRLPASKFCMYCGCNNKEDAPIEENQSEEVVGNSNSVVNKKGSVEFSDFSSNKHLMMPMAGLIVSFILLSLGFLFGGFSGLFSGMVVSDNSLSSDVKILSDNNKKIYYLKDGKIGVFDGYADKNDEEEIDKEKEKYFPSKNNSNFLDEINKNEIIDFDFTDATSDYGNKMVFLSSDKLFIVDNGVIDTIMLTNNIKSNSAAVSYFNYKLSNSTNFDSSKYINDKNLKYFDYDESSYNDRIYVIDDKSNYSYYEKDGYFSRVDVSQQSIKLNDFDIKGKKLYYSDNGYFIFGDSENIYILNNSGLVYKKNSIVYDDMNIALINIKHIFEYDTDIFSVVTNNGKIYNLKFEPSKGEFTSIDDENSNSFSSSKSGSVVSLIEGISFENLNLKDIIVLVIFFGTIILLGANLYLKMHSNYFSKLVSSTLILGIALSIILILYLYSMLKFKDIVLLLLNSFGTAFVIANIYLSCMDIICFILNKIRVNTLLNYILSFVLVTILLLTFLDYDLIVAFLLAVHIFWFVCVSNDISYNRTTKIMDEKKYYILSFITLGIVVLGLILGYSFLPDLKKEGIIQLLPYIVCLLSVLAPSIYLQKDFDVFMFLRMIFMGIFMYITPSIVNYIINVFEVLGSGKESGKVFGNYFKITIIVVIIVIIIIVLCTLVHVLTRLIVNFITKKLKMEGLILQTSLALLFYVILGAIALTFGVPLIEEIFNLLIKAFFGEVMAGLFSFFL